MNFNNGEKAASFFKLLLNDSVDYLALPTAFAKKYLEKGNNNKKQTLVLQPKSAVKWSVKYRQIEDKYYFMDGWLRFIKDNRLQVGDFLVFWLLSVSPKSRFQVFFYAPNGSLKHPIITSSGHFPSIIPNTIRRRPLLVEKVTAEPEVMPDGKKRCLKEKSNDDDDSLQKVHKSITKVVKESYLRHLPLTKRFWKATGLDRYDSVRMKTDKEKIWEVEVSKYGSIEFPTLTKGWYDFRKGNEMKKSNILQTTHVKGNLLHVKVIKKAERKYHQQEKKRSY